MGHQNEAFKLQKSSNSTREETKNKPNATTHSYKVQKNNSSMPVQFSHISQNCDHSFPSKDTRSQNEAQPTR